MSKELRFPNINNVVLSGRLTRDVELRYTKGGTAVAKISIAFSRHFQKDGEWQEETSYLDVTVWQKLAERCGAELHKGSPIIAQGYFKSGTYQDKENNNRKTFELVANYVSFLEKGETIEEPTLKREDVEETASVNNPVNTDDKLPF